MEVDVVKFKASTVMLLSLCPNVTVLPVVPLISPFCSKIISMFAVPFPTKISEAASPSSSPPPGEVIFTFILFSHLIFSLLL